ncbi:MAG: hypothetical protein JWN13_5323 [Betaproteobacteria bacterium]|jgi:hypothetical protein|nr:hypothetical protein [Betaproteobacteria bacterium]
MSGKLSRCVVHVVAVAALVLATGSASGQEYPNRIIRIVTAAPGGGSDFIARILAQGISGPLGQQIKNRQADQGHRSSRRVVLSLQGSMAHAPKNQSSRTTTFPI